MKKAVPSSERAIKVPTGMDGTSFRWDREEEKKRLILAIDGLEGHGKTHLAFTAPDPIAYQFIDRRHEGVISKSQFRGKRIGQAEYRLDMTGDDRESLQAEAQEVWARFKHDYLKTLKAGIRTVVWDTATEFWELCRLAAFGKLSSVRPFQYGPVNAEFRDLIREALNYDTNLLLLHKQGKEYENDEWNGKYARKGFNDSGFLVHAAVTTRLDPEDKEFHVICTKSGFDPDMIGFEWENPKFAEIAADLVPGTDKGDWE